MLQPNWEHWNQLLNRNQQTRNPCNSMQANESKSVNHTVRKTLTDCSSLIAQVSNPLGDEDCGEPWTGSWVKVLGWNDSSTTTFFSSSSLKIAAWTLHNFL